MNPNTDRNRPDSNRRNLTTADLASTGARKPGADARAEEMDPAERELMDRQRMDRERSDRERMDREQMERQRADRERMDGQRAAAREQSPAPDGAHDARSEKLDALFTPDAANDFRTQWTNIQSRFVDDPRQAVRDGDELVAQVMKSLAESFANERNKVETQLKDGGEGSTEMLRVALRRYRSFFERLLTL